MAECFGLWLARLALRVTGNRELARASGALPLIQQRRLLISVDPIDLTGCLWSDILCEGTWVVWNRPARGQQSHELS